MLESLLRYCRVTTAFLIVLGCTHVGLAAPKPVATESMAEAGLANTAAENTNKRAHSGANRRYRYTREKNAPSALGDGALLRSALTLSLLVLAFGGATALILRLLLRNRSRAGAGGRGLRKLATLPLSRKDALHVVRLGEEILVLATGAGTPTLVSRLEAERADRVEAELQGGGFAGWLRAATNVTRPVDPSAPTLYPRVRTPQARNPFGAPTP